MRGIVIALFLSGGGAAADCPPAPDHDAALGRLFAQAQAAETEAEADALMPEFWALWADAPDARAQALLNRGMTRRSGFDLLGALSEFDALVAYCPNYAEGYNQRAFVHYLRRNFAGALPDLDRAIALSPNHAAAMAGRALTLLGLGRAEEARAELDRALRLNPWLPERKLASPGGPLAPPGRDI